MLPIEWKTSPEPVDYPAAVAAMEARVAAIHAGTEAPLVWLLEHPPLYTAGTSAQASDLLTPKRFPVYQSGRGGQYTYHGPGQRIAYAMLDLREEQDVRCFVRKLEKWIINTLQHFDISGEIRDGRVGVWVPLPGGGEAKIAAIGIRLKRWISYHGIALNVDPDLEHFSGIVPCGIRDHGVTSLRALGINATMQEVDTVLKREFERTMLDGTNCST
ncbi:MAG: lipoyl(octanoyl) transferase LipB [Alphaproteobacteria bacterium]|nr:lipoyl(octanoyl) transferase LipB [Alphaproteobacteria bacterium]